MTSSNGTGCSIIVRKIRSPHTALQSLWNQKSPGTTSQHSKTFEKLQLFYDFLLAESSLQHYYIKPSTSEWPSTSVRIHWEIIQRHRDLERGHEESFILQSWVLGKTEKCEAWTKFLEINELKINGAGAVKINVSWLAREHLFHYSSVEKEYQGHQKRHFLGEIYYLLTNAQNDILVVANGIFSMRR